jgi:hypothetical protein
MLPALQWFACELCPEKLQQRDLRVFLSLDDSGMKVRILCCFSSEFCGMLGNENGPENRSSLNIFSLAVSVIQQLILQQVT